MSMANTDARATESVSSSSVSSSESESSDDVSSSSSSTASSSPSRGPSPPAPTATSTEQRRPPVASAGSTSWSASESNRRLNLNPNLQFAMADNLYIPLPPPAELRRMDPLRRMALDVTMYPQGRHRILDYFRAAVEMFVAQVRSEFMTQQKAAERANRPMTRFMWRNTGELAVCFACCCDTLKLLYDSTLPGQSKPLWEAFVTQFTSLLMTESRVPKEVLTMQTYHTKYMDWQKGGTRYGGEQGTANVRFPSAQERRVKIERYLSAGSGYRLEPVVVESTPAPVAISAPPPLRPIVTRPPGRLGVKIAARPLVGSFASPAGPGPVRPPTRTPAKTTGGAAAPASFVGLKSPPEVGHLQWLATLAHIKGSDPQTALAPHRAGATAGLVRLCNSSRMSDLLVLSEVIASSCISIQSMFERLGGVVALRDCAGKLIQAEDATSLMRLIDAMVRMRSPQWSTVSQRAWMKDVAQNSVNDLEWLRRLTIIPDDRRAAWGVLINVMEHKFIFRLPRDEGNGRKRPRVEPLTEGGIGTSASLSDMVELPAWKIPRVYTLHAVRLPGELRAPPFSSSMEQSMAALIDAKRRYAEEQQPAWEARLQQALSDVGVVIGSREVPIPLWYDPYQLLGVQPATADSGADRN